MMETVKNQIKTSFEYAKAFVKWLIIAAVVGAVGGVVGSLFHESIEYVTHMRTENEWLILLLPVGGFVIAVLYGVFGKKGKIDTNRVIEAVQTDNNVPLIMAPLIFVGTVITHLFGGSAGREGAALQLGGSLGYNVGKVLRLNKKDMHIIVMSGMSAVFAALFGTPLTAAFFAIEVISVGVIHYAALVPCLISSIIAYKIASLGFGIMPVSFAAKQMDISAEILLKVIILAVLCALVSIVFCTAIKKSEHYIKKLIPNIYLRAFVGGAVIVLLTIALQTTDYNGAGMNVIEAALSGTAKPWAFAVKILFTAITIAAGFKGGEIVPGFFIGSTFGCTMGYVLGLDPGFAAAIGFVALFCGVVNCPFASLLLAMEVFGGNSILLFAIACGVSFMMSGYFGLYKSQKFLYSKIKEEYVDINLQ